MYADPIARLRFARDDRSRTDYLFDFWTAFGWSLLTCGIFTYYVFYRLFERMRDHNRRRLAFLEALNEFAWQDAIAQGRDDELRARFERVGADLTVLRQMSTDFRDPAIWLLIIILTSGVGQLLGYYFLDVDLVKHEHAEASAAHQLSEILAALGRPIPAPAPVATKAPHSYAARIVVTLVTCGVYGLWWLYDLMVEPNEHFKRDWAFEDAVLQAITP